MATRHQVRQAVISMLYAHEMNTFSDEFALEFLAEQKIKNEQKNFALCLLSGILGSLKELDDTLNACLTSFKLDEIGAMERAILRLGAYELKSAQSDARIIISEAVVLASEFGGESATRLINGVLNSIFKGEIPQKADETKDEKEFYENLKEIENSVKKQSKTNKKEIAQNSKQNSSKSTKNSRIPKQNSNKFAKNSRNPKKNLSKVPKFSKNKEKS